ncbi:MAG: DUF1641 domain-containing protein [Firmicutes bacterium]|nr:DUF1641 domain-containing protein [Bacillota bacterium]
MAQAITTIQQVKKTSAQIQDEQLAEVQAVLAEHADSVRAFVHLIEAMYGAGLLQAGTALLEQGEDILQVVVSQAAKPEYAGGLKNGLKLMQVLGSDLTPIFGMMDALSHASEQKSPEVTGVFSLLRAFKDPDVQAGTGYLLGMLKAIGAGVREQSDAHSGQR